MTVATAVDEYGHLSEAGSEILAEVYRRFSRGGTWPRYRDLQLHFGEHADFPRLTWELELDYLATERPVGEQSQCFLTLAGLVACPKAMKDVERLSAVARFLGERYAQERETAKVDARALAEACALNEAELVRILALLERTSFYLASLERKQSDAELTQCRASAPSGQLAGS